MPRKSISNEMLRGHLQSISDGITKIEQNGIKKPGSPKLQFDAIERACPEIAQIQHALQNVEGLFDTPTAAIEVSHDARRQDFRV